MNLGAYGARSDTTSVVAGAGSTTEASAVSTPVSGRQIGRLAHSTSSGGRGSNGNANMADSDGYSVIKPSDGAAPIYYPMHQVHKVWPHQIIPSLSQHRTLEQKLEISDAYLMQIVDKLGELPASFDSVNAAVTRVAVMRSAASDVGSCHELPPCTMSFNEESKVHDRISSNAAAAVTDAGPDGLRANFIEICKDKNSLEMFWQQTIQRYRAEWRDIKTGKAAESESLSRPMIVDMFTEAMWQPRRHSAPYT
ncbi:hypothetical protein IWW36_001343 [Coemansia brasiliensis]|uniref:Uncharacterized protein n=1 Tax=Coemansia brasiliensis TaxID=2650707 RepID=A0A9W8I943_9FUNG|nr:hypothetical protein IWW36_001343 [Coemansia brasiliensis]